MSSSTTLLMKLYVYEKKKGTKLSCAEESAKRFFRDRGISPTLKEFKEVVSSYMNGTKPMGIH